MLVFSGPRDYWEGVMWAVNEARSHINLTVATPTARELCGQLGTFAEDIRRMLAIPVQEEGIAEYSLSEGSRLR